MEENYAKLSELRTVYDELWSDAKTLAKEMKRSIWLYIYAAYVTIVVIVASITSAIPYYIQAFLGTANVYLAPCKLALHNGALITAIGHRTSSSLATLGSGHFLVSTGTGDTAIHCVAITIAVRNSSPTFLSTIDLGCLKT